MVLHNRPVAPARPFALMPMSLLRAVSVTVLAAALGAAPAAAQALVFVVNEGVTYRVSADEIRAKYAPVAADLAKILRQPVTVEPVGDYPTLRRGLAAKEYDVAYVHPAHISMLAMRDSGYKLVAVTKGFQNYAANFIVRSDSALKSLTDLQSSSLGVPDEDSITAWMVRATMRDTLGTRPPTYYYTRYQDAVPYFVDNNLTKAGATASGGVVKAWTGKGGRVIGKSKAVPIKHMLAGPNLSAEQVQRLRDYFIGLDASEDGRKKLEAIKYEGFAAFSEADMLALGKWLGL